MFRWFMHTFWKTSGNMFSECNKFSNFGEFSDTRLTRIYEMDEKHLLTKIRCGSTESFQVLYERWVSRLYSFVYYYVKSETLADDIVQETFLRVWTNRHGLDPDCSFKSYLFTISYHLLLKELRRQLNNPAMEDYVAFENQLSTFGEYIESHIDFERFRKELAKAKSKLTSRQREIFE